MKNKFIYLAVLAAGFTSCEPEFENDVNSSYTSGDANFSSYVAVGNSLTAGYMDGTVSRGGQMNSFPNLLATQFATVGGGVFTQPSYADDVNNLGGLMLGGMPIGATRLVIDASQSRPENIAGTSTIEVSNLQKKAFHNMGVPGAKSFHLVAPNYGDVGGVSVGTANPYFVRHATTSAITVLDDAKSMNPTFFTNWIGNNDVLSYATNGGTTPMGGVAVDGGMGANDITPTGTFNAVYSQIINELTVNGAKGVVATIPNVTSIPYFTTVPFNPLTPAKLGGVTNINDLNNDLYGPLNGIFSAYGEPNRVKLLSATGANPLLIIDVDAADRSLQITGALTGTFGPTLAAELGAIFGKARQATAADLVVLTASSYIGTLNTTPSATLASLGININGVTFPLGNKWVLSANEKAKVANATASYNASIVAIAASKNLAVADMNAIMNKLVGGLRIETGQMYTANYFSGSSTEGQVLFSLDGVHPNARGYAVIANEVIKVINSYYHANIPLNNPSYSPGINIVPVN